MKKLWCSPIHPYSLTGSVYAALELVDHSDWPPTEILLHLLFSDPSSQVLGLKVFSQLLLKPKLWGGYSSDTSCNPCYPHRTILKLSEHLLKNQ